MWQTNSRGLSHIRMTHCRVFEIDRADPLTPGLDHILAAIDDLHAALGIDRRAVAGAEPALGIERALAGGFVLIVGADDPGTPDQQLAACDPILGEALAVGVDDL